MSIFLWAEHMRVADLFCGIGSFHYAARALGHEVVFACDADPAVRMVYEATWGLRPWGDIDGIQLDRIPDHDILCAGPPCQAFSLIGRKRGMGDERGRLMFRVAEVLRAKRPRFFVVENVRNLIGAPLRPVFESVLQAYRDAGYKVCWHVLDCADYGIPQGRRRLFIVGSRDEEFNWEPPTARAGPSLAELLGQPGLRPEKPLCRTIRTQYRPNSKDKRSFAYVPLEGGGGYVLSRVDAEALQGFPPQLLRWGGLNATRVWRALGNTIPTCLTTAVLGSLGDLGDADDGPRRRPPGEREVAHGEVPRHAEAILDPHVPLQDDVPADEVPRGMEMEGEGVGVVLVLREQPEDGPEVPRRIETLQ